MSGRHKVGDRIFAVRDATKTQVNLFGVGVYDGDFTPPGFEDAPDFKNPRMTLDDGTQVWGMECWWGPESRLQSWAGGRTIVTVERAK